MLLKRIHQRLLVSAIFLRYLHRYVPVDHEGIPHTIPCHGDGLSVERMCDSQRHFTGGATPVERLESFHWFRKLRKFQEFHKRALLIQVYNLCFFISEQIKFVCIFFTSLLLSQMMVEFALRK